MLVKDHHIVCMHALINQAAEQAALNRRFVFTPCLDRQTCAKVTDNGPSILCSPSIVVAHVMLAPVSFVSFDPKTEAHLLSQLV